MLKVVIFDLDGVLIDSESLMRSAFAASYRRVVGEGTPPVEAYLEQMGESFPRIMDRLGLPRASWEPYREYCQQHLEEIKLFPGTRPLLEWAHKSGLDLALLTGKDRVRTWQTLERFDLLGFFRIVVASDQLQFPKPHPEGVLKVLSEFKCEAREAVMIGDSVNDITCAQEVDVRTVAVTWGIKPQRVQELCHPDYIAHDWEMLQRILEGLKCHG